MKTTFLYSSWAERSSVVAKLKVFACVRWMQNLLCCVWTSVLRETLSTLTWIFCNISGLFVNSQTAWGHQALQPVFRQCLLTPRCARRHSETTAAAVYQFYNHWILVFSETNPVWTRFVLKMMWESICLKNTCVSMNATWEMQRIQFVFYNIFQCRDHSEHSSECLRVWIYETL